LENSESTGDAEPPYWLEKELSLVRHVELFQNKPAILKKVENRLIALQKALAKEIHLIADALPDHLDLIKNQIVRGENLNGFPFISLDYPQNFSKTEMFTLRTLFWWGHYLGFSLILKGKRLESYLENLLENRNAESFSNIYISLAPDPWEWEINKTNYSSIDQISPDGLRKTILELDYLKIIRVFPVEKENFMTLNWAQSGLQFWKDLTPVTFGI
jgi:hypothetical protein